MVPSMLSSESSPSTEKKEESFAMAARRACRGLSGLCRRRMTSTTPTRHEVSVDQKSRLLSINEKQNRTTDRIRDSRRTMLETEAIGISILKLLQDDRERLIHAHAKLNDGDDNIGKSRRIMGAMVRRMDRNKWIIGFIKALLVLAILVILYFKFVH